MPMIWKKGKDVKPEYPISTCFKTKRETSERFKKYFNEKLVKGQSKNYVIGKCD